MMAFAIKEIGQTYFSIWISPQAEDSSVTTTTPPKSNIPKTDGWENVSSFQYGHFKGRNIRITQRKQCFAYGKYRHLLIPTPRSRTPFGDQQTRSFPWRLFPVPFPLSARPGRFRFHRRPCFFCRRLLEDVSSVVFGSKGRYSRSL